MYAQCMLYVGTLGVLLGYNSVHVFEYVATVYEWPRSRMAAVLAYGCTAVLSVYQKLVRCLSRLRQPCVLDSSHLRPI